MRKIYILLFLLSAASASFAQNYSAYRPAKVIPWAAKRPINHHPASNASGPTQITIDYTDAELNYYQNEANLDYHAFTNVGNINDAFSNGIVGYRYLNATVDSLYDFNTGTSYLQSDVTDITVDSFTVFVNHTDSSHTTNTFYAEIIGLNAKGYPTGTVLWKDSMTTVLSWGAFTPLTFRPNFLVPTNKYGYRFDFKGDTSLDNFNVIVGCHAPKSTVGACNGFNVCDSLSHFYANSYGFILQGIDLLLPTSNGGFLYEDCNSNGMFDSTVDGRDYLQDLYVISDITLDVVTGVKAQPNAVNNLKIYPNPAKNETTISYSLVQGGKVSAVISDELGRIVKQYPQQVQASGPNRFTADVSMLQQGLYFVHLYVNGKDVSVNKLSVSRN